MLGLFVADFICGVILAAVVCGVIAYKEHKNIEK